MEKILLILPLVAMAVMLYNNHKLYPKEDKQEQVQRKKPISATTDKGACINITYSS